MSGATKISWATDTWNPLVGCSLVSPGCTNCYAMREAGTRLAHLPRYAGLTEPSRAGPVWTGEVRLVEEVLTWPTRKRRPRLIFVNSMSDLFHEAVPDEFIDQIFAVMEAADRHVFQVLTKRPRRMRDFMQRYAKSMSVPPNVWLGTSVEDQERADERIPLLLDTPAAVRWISMEPQIGPVNLRDVGGDAGARLDALTGEWMTRFGGAVAAQPARLDWVVIGGESGAKAREFKLEWARETILECTVADVPVFMKQIGSRPTWCDIPVGHEHRAGADPSEWPAALRVQQYPKALELHHGAH